MLEKVWPSPNKQIGSLPVAIDQPQRYMAEALVEARRADDLGEVPIGAVIVHEGKVVARAHNETECSCDSTAHAEVVAIRRAESALGKWRLNDAQLFVTCEPCPMCIGAILLARIERLYFGCYDPVQGAVGSVFDLSNHPSLPRSIEVFPALMEQECANLLEQFFKKKRTQSS